MLSIILLLLGLQATSLSTEELIRQVSESGRCATVGESADRRVTTQPMIAPGQPPLLSFRYYEGRLHHRFGNSDLMLDDAGH